VAFLKTMALGAIIDVDATKAIAAVRGLSGVMKTASRGLTTLGGGLTSFGSTMLKVGAIGVGLAAGVGLLANQAATFEQQMASVRSVMLDVEGRHMPALKRRAEELALATTFSATQVGQGMELMARAGFKTEEIIEGVGGVLAVAAAEGIELAESAGIVSATLKGMGLEADQAGRVADVLAVAATSTKSSIGTLGLAMANASTTAKTFGLSLEDTVASVALMQDIGIDAAESGTALKTMLLRLAKPSDKVKAKMNKLGFAIQDADGNMLPFQQVIGNLSKTLPKLGGNIDQAAFLTDLFGLRGIKAGIALADAFKKPDGNLTQMIEKLQDAKGAAQDMADLKLDNLRDQIGLVGSSMEVLSSRLFGPFLEVSKQGVKDLVVLLNEVALGLAGEGTSSAAEFGKGMEAAMSFIRDGIEATRDAVVDIMKRMDGAFGDRTAKTMGVISVALVAITIALTPVALGIGTIALALGALLTTVGLVVGAFATLGAPVIFAILLIAIGLVQTAIMALVPAGLAVVAAFAFMKANGGSVGNFLAQTWGRMRGAWMVFTTVFMRSWDEIRAAFLPVLAILRSAFADVTTGMAGDFEQTNMNILNIATAMAEVAVFAAKMVAGFAAWGAIIIKVGALFFRHIVAPVGKFFGGLTAKVLKFGADFATGLSGMFRSTTQLLSDTFEKLITFADGYEKAMLGIVNAILSAMRRVVDATISMARNPLVQFAMKKAGLDPTKTILALQDVTRGAFAPATAAPLGVADTLRNVQSRLNESLAREARQRAAVTAPDVSAEVTVEDKRTVCIDNQLTVDGREFAIASKEAEVELTERAGFTVTPWQKRQILERGASVLNPT
jgi:TP901 family phage tail tape measure protein